MKKIHYLAIAAGLVATSGLPFMVHANTQASVKKMVDEYVIDGERYKKFGPEVMPILADMYRDAKDLRTKNEIVQIISSIGWESREAKYALLADVNTQDEELRIHLQYALGHISSDDDVVQTLLDKMQNDPNAYFRDKAACALAYDQRHLNEKQKFKLIEGLIGALDNATPQVRAIAIKALKIQTGQTKGFSPNAPKNERDVKVEVWKLWLEEYRKNI